LIEEPPYGVGFVERKAVGGMFAQLMGVAVDESDKGQQLPIIAPRSS
jgi:hypothetical protein